MYLCRYTYLLSMHPNAFLLFHWSLTNKSPGSCVNMKKIPTVECDHATKILLMRYFMSLRSSHKGFPRCSYVIIMTSVLLPESLFFVAFAAAVGWLSFDGYRIIWFYCGFSCWDEFCMPLIIALTSRLCSG